MSGVIPQHAFVTYTTTTLNLPVFCGFSVLLGRRLPLFKLTGSNKRTWQNTSASLPFISNFFLR